MQSKHLLSNRPIKKLDFFVIRIKGGTFKQRQAFVSCWLTGFGANLINWTTTKSSLVRRVMIFFEKKWAPLFVYFWPFLITISIIQIVKSVDGVLGIQTCSCMMVGADNITELWRPPCWYFNIWISNILFPLNKTNFVNAIKNFESKLPPKFKNKNIPFTHLTKKIFNKIFCSCTKKFFLFWSNLDFLPKSSIG